MGLNAIQPELTQVQACSIKLLVILFIQSNLEGRSGFFTVSVVERMPSIPEASQNIAEGSNSKTWQPNSINMHYSHESLLWWRVSRVKSCEKNVSLQSVRFHIPSSDSVIVNFVSQTFEFLKIIPVEHWGLDEITLISYLKWLTSN